MGRGPLLSSADGDTTIDDLHRRFHVPLARFFQRRIRDRAVAEDMVQQVFEQLIRRGDVGSIENVSAYIFRTARTVIAEHFRKEATRPVASEPFEESRHGGVDFSPEHVLVNREGLSEVFRVIDTLPERTRLIFLLRRLEGLRYRDIAERLDISVSAVEKHMERAVRHLLERLEDPR